MIKIAICDDEVFYLNQIEKYARENLDKMGVTQVEIDTFHSGNDLLKAEEYLTKCQVLFLDINMQDCNGVDVAHEIKQKNPDIYLIFVTAYMDYVLMGYRVEAFRFLLKDNLEDMMRECIPSLLQKMQRDDARLNILLGGGQMLKERKSLKIKDILYVESYQHRMTYHMVGDKANLYQKSGNLIEIEQMLARFGFCRVHKSYLVNMRLVESVERYEIHMCDGIKLPIPRDKYQMVREEYIRIMGDV